MKNKKTKATFIPITATISTQQRQRINQRIEQLEQGGRKVSLSNYLRELIEADLRANKI